MNPQFLSSPDLAAIDKQPRPPADHSQPVRDTNKPVLNLFAQSQILWEPQSHIIWPKPLPVAFNVAIDKTSGAREPTFSSILGSLAYDRRL